MDNDLVVLVAFLGLSILAPADTNLGDPDENDVTTPNPTRSPTSAPRAIPGVAELDPGTYLVSNAGNTPRAFTVTVPAGWHTEEGFISKGDGIGRSPGAVRELTVELDRQPRVRRCVCLRPEGDNLASLVETGTADEIAQAIEVQGGHETIGPAATMLGGYPAQRLEFAFPADYDLAACDDDFLRPWPEPGPNFGGGLAAYVGQRAIDAPLSAGRARLLARLLRPWRRA